MSGGLVEALSAHHTGFDPRTHQSTCTCGWWGPRRLGAPLTASDERNAHLADVVTAHLAARLEGCEFELYDAIGNATEMWGEWSDDAATAVKAVFRESVLGLESPSEAPGGGRGRPNGA